MEYTQKTCRYLLNVYMQVIKISAIIRSKWSQTLCRCTGLPSPLEVVAFRLGTAPLNDAFPVCEV